MVSVCSITYSAYGLLTTALSYLGMPPPVNAPEAETYQKFLKMEHNYIYVNGRSYDVCVRGFKQGSSPDKAQGDDLYTLAMDIMRNYGDDPQKMQEQFEEAKRQFLWYFWDELEIDERARNIAAQVAANRIAIEYNMSVNQFFKKYDMKGVDYVNSIENNFIGSYRDPERTVLDSYVSEHDRYVSLAMQGRARAAARDVTCAHQEVLVWFIRNKVLPVLNQRLYFKVKDPELLTGDTFDKSAYSGYHKDREISGYAKYMSFLDEKGKPLFGSEDGEAKGRFFGYPINADKSEYNAEAVQPYPRKNSDVVFVCTRYHFIQMRAPGYLALYGSKSLPEIRIPIVIPPYDGSGTMEIELSMDQNRNGFYLTQGYSYYAEEGGVKNYGGYSAYAVYVVWDTDKDQMIVYDDITEPSDVNGEVSSMICERLPKKSGYDYGAYTPLTGGVLLKEIDYRSVLEGPLEQNDPTEVPKHMDFYVGYYKLVNRNGEWFVEATGEKAPFKNGRLTVSESKIQSMEIGKQFMESVTRYAKEKGLSMKTAPEGGSKPTSDPGWGDAPIIGPGADGW